MKILYLDLLYPIGHIKQNERYIALMSNFAKVYVLCEKNRYKNLATDVEIIDKPNLKLRNGRITSRIDSLKIMIVSSIEAAKIKPDYIFISSYDTIMFSLGKFMFRSKDKLFLLQHSNIDEISNKIKKLFFSTYVSSVNIIVFEKFIQDYILQTFHLSKDKLFILPHQLNQNLLERDNKKYHCIGLSFSNEETLILQIVNKEKNESLFKNAKCKVVLKSKNIEFDNGYLTVIKGYIDDDVYNEYINNCLCIYMPFSSSFKYRMSGTLVDALSNNKILLGSNIPVVKYYSLLYPHICKVINNVDDFYRQILNIEFKHDMIEEFKQFKDDHSDEIIENVFREMFNY